MTQNQLWMRWTLANALSEMVGLGLTFAITGLLFSHMGEADSVMSIFLWFVVAVRSGGRCIRGSHPLSGWPGGAPR
jgi:hypothetical protein